MLKFKELAKQGLVALSGISAILTIKDWYTKQSELTKFIKEAKELKEVCDNNLNYLHKLLENTQLNAEMRANLQKSVSFFEKKLSEANTKSDILSQLVNGGKFASGAEADIKEIAEGFQQDISEMRTSLDTIRGIAENSNDKHEFISDFVNYITKFQDYLSTLTVYQVYGLIHIICALLLLLLVFNLASVFYGEYLIKYFKLTSRFPRLAGLINLRSKFQQYYFGWNLLLILVTLFALLYVNLIVFLNISI